MSILNTNKLTWFKDGGEPLKSGYVYVGQPGLDPQVPANQKNGNIYRLTRKFIPQRPAFAYRRKW